MLYLVYRICESVLDALRHVAQLVEIVAHLLLALQLHRHHASFELLLLLESARMARLARLLEELEAVRDALLVHGDALLEHVKCA